uniref:Uncharacterized protein n=1 Tax=Oryza glumipatula TaxID=40148 RepID=A0A0E0BVE6_9ORYZ
MAAVAPIAMPARVHHHHHHRRRALAASPAALAAAGNGLSATRRVRRSPAVEMRRERERRRAREQQPRCGEVAGGTAAECAAVFCCFPFAVVELVVLAAVRAPAALCRRAVRGGRRRRVRSTKPKETGAMDIASPRSLAAAAAKARKVDADFPATPKAEHLVDMEKEVWASFYGGGFWRSPSQREDRR